jgi:3alpha(or 20beta)-hydroxysteroid dehydrogenase
MGRLEGKIAIITGAARGQGANEARRFVAEGAKVVLTDLSDGGEKVAAELGENAIFLQHNVSDEDAWRHVVDFAVKKFGRIDILVNNAGIFTPHSIVDTTKESFDRHYQVNQLGVFLGTKAVIEPMKASGGGSIVNISSAAGVRGYPDMIAYAGTKWAVRGMTKCAARELAPMRIRVNSVHPGLVDTPMLDDHTPEALKEFANAVPLGRIGTPDDVAEIVIFLASDLSSYLTGAEIVADGGLGL